MKAPDTSPAFVVAVTVACVVDTWAAGALAAGTWGSQPALLAHAAVVVALAGWCALPSSRRDLRLPLLLTLATAFLGPIGAAGTAVTAVAVRRYARTATPFEVWYASLFPDVERPPTMRRAAGGHASGRGGVAPFADILSFGQLSQKQELITLIASEFRPEFAHVLRLALNDPNNAVRVQAATAIARIEDQFSQRTQELSDAVLAHPADKARVWSLATLLDEYASAGIMDRERAAAVRGQAIRAYTDYLALVGDDDAARQAIGRLCLQGGDHAGAARWLEREGDGVVTLPESRLIYMEALFELGRFDDLRRYAALHARDLLLTERLPLETRETTKLWAVAGA